ncbi:MAG: pyridoxal-dependent decarboxylase [Caulobacteraceae bacterium]|nr:pyridoxal-dependent decarboxylase [Caulobacteraceae bacterium]
MASDAASRSGTHGRLDPADWQAFRAQGHRMLDDMLDHIERLREQPVWRPMPAEVRAGFRAPPPAVGEDLASVHEDFLRNVLPYAGGNLHPGFMGWVQGGGTPVGMLAEMLAGGLNANLGGRDHAPIQVEREVAGWVRDLFGFPEAAGGLFVTGASMANFIGVLAARTRALGRESRRTGLRDSERRLTAYVSRAAHACVVRAMEMSGLGSDALRVIGFDADQRIDLAALRAAIAADRRAGMTPFLIVGNAGTVDVGAIDDLSALADIAREEGAWLHLDGAYGALGVLSPKVAPKLAGLERADSVAFDFHKWGQVPYDAGFLIARDAESLRAAFATPAAYLQREQRGLAGGDWWPCDYGPDLSRGFRALKTWFTLRVCGLDAIGAAITASCDLARALQARIEAEPALELLAPAQLNIVCFRYRCPDPDPVNRSIVIELQEEGRVAPSLTEIGGKAAIRAALFNHRTTMQDVDALIEGAVRFGRAATQLAGAA